MLPLLLKLLLLLLLKLLKLKLLLLLQLLLLLELLLPELLLLERRQPRRRYRYRGGGRVGRLGSSPGAPKATAFHALVQERAEGTNLAPLFLVEERADPCRLSGFGDGCRRRRRRRRRR